MKGILGKYFFHSIAVTNIAVFIFTSGICYCIVLFAVGETPELRELIALLTWGGVFILDIVAVFWHVLDMMSDYYVVGSSGARTFLWDLLTALIIFTVVVALSTLLRVLNITFLMVYGIIMTVTALFFAAKSVD